MKVSNFPKRQKNNNAKDFTVNDLTKRSFVDDFHALL